MLDYPILIAYAVTVLLAIADVWLSQLGRASRVLWTLSLVFLPGAGLLSWLVTRGSAHQPAPELPDEPEAAIEPDPHSQPHS
jgi:hypothetical protein